MIARGIAIVHFRVIVGKQGPARRLDGFRKLPASTFTKVKVYEKLAKLAKPDIIISLGVYSLSLRASLVCLKIFSPATRARFSLV